jgi:hypothetical protein
MILVFKTNINAHFETKVRAILSVLEPIDKIIFDFEDCDNVLKIVAQYNIVSEVETLLKSKGFSCREL